MRDTAAIEPRSGRASWAGALVVLIIALGSFAYRLPEEPHFADEGAYYTQSYFASLFAEGRLNDPEWLAFMAYDLPPLPKYLIGAALSAVGFELPTPVQAAQWYSDTSLRVDPPGTSAHTVARVPSVLLGGLGCLAVYGLGVMIGGRGMGLLAGVILAVNPLYRLLARRAMSDVPCEAFMLLTLALAMTGWRLAEQPRGKLWAGTASLLSGVAAGLALLSKLSGLLALMILGVWAILALSGKTSRTLALAGLVVPILTASLTFIGLDPYLTAQPSRRLPPEFERVKNLNMAERAAKMWRLRLRTAADQQKMFSHNALYTPAEKLATVSVQGFGRFGPFGPAHSDSTRRFDIAQDWGAALWLPLVLAGVIWAYFQGRTQHDMGTAPTAWALLVAFGVVLAVVTAYLPMAWDRYLLPIQAPATLLAAGAITSVASRLRKRGSDPAGVS